MNLENHALVVKIKMDPTIEEALRKGNRTAWLELENALREGVEEQLRRIAEAADGPADGAADVTVEGAADGVGAEEKKKKNKGKKNKKKKKRKKNKTKDVTNVNGEEGDRGVGGGGEKD